MFIAYTDHSKSNAEPFKSLPGISADDCINLAVGLAQLNKHLSNESGIKPVFTFYNDDGAESPISGELAVIANHSYHEHLLINNHSFASDSLPNSPSFIFQISDSVFSPVSGLGNAAFIADMFDLFQQDYYRQEKSSGVDVEHTYPELLVRTEDGKYIDWWFVDSDGETQYQLYDIAFFDDMIGYPNEYNVYLKQLMARAHVLLSLNLPEITDDLGKLVVSFVDSEINRRFRLFNDGQASKFILDAVEFNHRILEGYAVDCCEQHERTIAEAIISLISESKLLSPNGLSEASDTIQRDSIPMSDIKNAYISTTNEINDTLNQHGPLAVVKHLIENYPETINAPILIGSNTLLDAFKFNLKMFFITCIDQKFNLNLNIQCRIDG